MSMTTCRECKVSVSDEAEKCPSCGIKNPAMSKNISSIIGTVVGTIFWIIVALALIGHFSKSSSKANCELIGKSLNEDIFLIQGEPDAGFRFDVTVKNSGDKGEITFNAKLSSSEGEFERKQTLMFNSQETSTLSFNFHEPTINVDNVQASVTCEP